MNKQGAEQPNKHNRFSMRKCQTPNYEKDNNNLPKISANIFTRKLIFSNHRRVKASKHAD